MGKVRAIINSILISLGCIILMSKLMEYYPEEAVHENDNPEVETVPASTLQPQTRVYIQERPTLFKHRDIYKYENGYRHIDNPGLIEFIQQRWLVHPEKDVNQNANPMETETDYSQDGQSKIVDDFLKRKRDGFFIESGAGNGVFISNSLFFEKFRGWTGLLVEPNINSFANIVPARPRSYAINSCLSVKNKTEKVQFELYGSLSSISNSTGKRWSKVTVQCFPLYTILKAIGVETVDYWSLDVEGVELDILKTIPWQKLRINILTIEYRATPGSKNGDAISARKLQQLRDFFSGIKIYKEVRNLISKRDNKGLDVVFARRDIL